MLRLTTIVATLALASTAAAESALLPMPAELEPNVRFWTRIYTEVDGRGGLVHDSEHLGVVYEVVRFEPRASRRSRERAVSTVKKRVVAALQSLARGKRTNLSNYEALVLSRWPADVSDKTLRRATSHIRFQLGQADKFREGLVRSGYWADHIERALAKHGVPRELVALPLVESSFNPRAYSRVGAAGIWQFTRSTGRLYMRVDHVVDERMDPFRATVAAARLLRDNYERLQAWPLAITAYNHGTAGMARAVRTTGTTDMGVISRNYKSRTFGFASRNFYSEFLAAWHVYEDPERYFGPIQPASPLDYEFVETDAYYPATSLARALGVDADELRAHNLALLPSVWTGAKLVPRGYAIRVPRSELPAPIDPTTVLAAIPASERLAQQKRDRFHKVRRGETLSRIAGRYGTSSHELARLNNLRSRHSIRAGQVLRLPSDGSVPIHVARSEPPSDGIYRVRRGDNLTIIAARFGVGTNDIVAWNGLRNRNRLSVGQRLQVARPAQIASAAVTASDAKLVAKAPPAAAKPEPEVERTVASEPEADPEPEPELEPEMAAVAPLEPEDDDSIPTAASVVAVLERPDVAVPDPSNYAVTASGRVTVQADETIGHYADWLEVSASQLRRLNGMRYGTPLAIGRQKKLDFSRVTPEVFEMRRLEYHRALQEEFFAAWEVSGTTTYQIRRGDSLWHLAHRKYEVPVWLLRQYNPDVDFAGLTAGTSLVIPLLEPRSEAAPAPPASNAATRAN